MVAQKFIAIPQFGSGGRRGHRCRTGRAHPGAFAGPAAFARTAGLLCGLLAIAAALPLPAGAESLQQNAARLLDGVPTLQQAAGWGFAELWQMAKDYLAANIGEPLAFGLRAAGYLLVAGSPEERQRGVGSSHTT